MPRWSISARRLNQPASFYFEFQIVCFYSFCLIERTGPVLFFCTRARRALCITIVRTLSMNGPSFLRRHLCYITDINSSFKSRQRRMTQCGNGQYCYIHYTKLKDFIGNHFKSIKIRDDEILELCRLNHSRVLRNLQMKRVRIPMNLEYSLEAVEVFF